MIAQYTSPPSLPLEKGLENTHGPPPDRYPLHLYALQIGLLLGVFFLELLDLARHLGQTVKCHLIVESLGRDVVHEFDQEIFGRRGIYRGSERGPVEVVVGREPAHDGIGTLESSQLGRCKLQVVHGSAWKLAGAAAELQSGDRVKMR